jgi:hypothetical protein
MNVETIADLARLRHSVGRLVAHDDERLRDATVILTRNGATVGRIACASDALAWDAYRICAGIRYRQENGAAWQAAEAEPMAIAA